MLAVSYRQMEQIWVYDLLTDSVSFEMHLWHLHVVGFHALSCDSARLVHFLWKNKSQDVHPTARSSGLMSALHL